MKRMIWIALLLFVLSACKKSESTSEPTSFESDTASTDTMMIDTTDTTVTGTMSTTDTSATSTDTTGTTRADPDPGQTTTVPKTKT